MFRGLGVGLSIVLWLSGCAHEGATPDAYDASAVQSLRIPGGKRCLSLLNQLGVRYKKLSPRGHVATPVEITGAFLLEGLRGRMPRSTGEPQP